MPGSPPHERSRWLRIDNAADEHTFGVKIVDGTVVNAPFSASYFMGASEEAVRSLCAQKGWTVEDVNAE